MSGGVRTALEEVLEAQGDDAAPVQGGLFDAEEIGAVGAPSPLSAALPARTGPGRRPGSRNRRTDAVVGWLLAQHRHPLSVMMEAYTMTPAELAERIGLAKPEKSEVYDNATLLELLKLQLRMAEAVAPYVAQRQPLAVQVDAKAALTLSFEGVSLPARGVGGGTVADQVEGAMALRLPMKSDDASRTED